MDDDPVGEGLVVRLDVQRPLFPVQAVFLDEVHVVHPRNLQIQRTPGSLCRARRRNAENGAEATHSLQQARGVHVQSAAPLDPVGGPVLAGLLAGHVTRHKHGDEVTGGKPALIGLKTTGDSGGVS